jgi:hypothetical protein
VTVATYSLTTSPTMIDDGTSYSMLVTNTGAATVELSRGGRLRPNQAQTVYPEGAALTAAAVTGTSSVSTSTTTKPLPNAADPAALAANAAFTGTYAGLRAPRRAASILRGTAAANESMYYTSAFTNVPSCNSVKRYTAYRSTSGVRLVYGNANSIETNTGLVAITVRAAVDDGTTKIPVYFSGKRDVTIDVGGIAISDPVAITLTAGQTFYARTFATSSDSLHIPYMGTEAVTYSTWGEGCDASNGVTATDKTLSGTVTANNVSHYSPMVITCADDGTGPLVSLNGDSIMSGVGEVSPFVAAGRGFARRALNNTIPYVMSAAAGSKLSDPRVLRRPLLTACSDALCNSGINDLGGGGTLASIQANMLAEWTWHANLGARVWQCTILPKTTSTDTWATTANQTAVAFNASRTGLNDWIRAGAPIVNGVAVAVGTSNAVVAGQPGHPLKGYFETADIVETSRNSGIWTPAYVYTTDSLGVHPNSAGHAALAAAIDTSKFI